MPSSSSPGKWTRSDTTDQVVKLKALEAFEKAADGKATKLIIPSEIQGLAGLAASAKEIFTGDGPEEKQTGRKARQQSPQGRLLFLRPGKPFMRSMFSMFSMPCEEQNRKVHAL